MSPSSSSSAAQAQQVLADPAHRDPQRRRTDRTGTGPTVRLGPVENLPDRRREILLLRVGSAGMDRTMRRRCQITDLIASLRTVEGMWVECRRMTLGGLRPVQASYLPLYERTHQFRAYSSWLIPGMLQTREYATAVFGTIQARDDLIDDVTAATNTRIDRQQLMYDGDHRFAYLLEEFVLHCDIGGSDIMAAQLGHLLTVGTVPNVSLGVIPTNTTRITLARRIVLDLRQHPRRRRTDLRPTQRHPTPRDQPLHPHVHRTHRTRRLRRRRTRSHRRSHQRPRMTAGPRRPPKPRRIRGAVVFRDID